MSEPANPLYLASIAPPSIQTVEDLDNLTAKTAGGLFVAGVGSRAIAIAICGNVDVDLFNSAGQ
jgi:hypothetical protein